MSELKSYSRIFNIIVEKTIEYLIHNNIRAMILGISGGIDSTVCAAICAEVNARTGIPLIGRSIPSRHNKTEETSTADLVGKAFCNNYKETSLQSLLYHAADWTVDEGKDFAKLQLGNIQARLRMMYLYNLATLHRGIVIDTDNLTEHNLGYWTLHGDVGDFNPIGGLWKTEIFKLAKTIKDLHGLQASIESPVGPKNHHSDCVKAIEESLKLKPTAGLGITDSDLEEIGAESYEQVDDILQEILAWKQFNIDCGSHTLNKERFLEDQQMLNYPIEVIKAVVDRHFASEFKRNKLPVVIGRDVLQQKKFS